MHVSDILTKIHVLIVDLNIVIPVSPALLMVKSKSVVHLVLDGSIGVATGGVVNVLGTSNAANVGVAASLRSLEVDVVALGGAGDKLDAAVGDIIVVLEDLGDLIQDGVG